MKLIAQIMPPRLNKRQQRELEELEALNLGKQTQGLNLSSEEEDIPRGGGGFSNVSQFSINDN